MKAAIARMLMRVAQWQIRLARRVDRETAERTTIGGGGGPG